MTGLIKGQIAGVRSDSNRQVGTFGQSIVVHNDTIISQYAPRSGVATASPPPAGGQASEAPVCVHPNRTKPGANHRRCHSTS